MNLVTPGPKNGYKTLGAIKPGQSLTLKIGSYVTGQPFMLYCTKQKKVVSGTYHAPTPSSAKVINVYFQSNGKISLQNCGPANDLLMYAAIGGGILLVLALLYWYFYMRQ